VKRAFVIGHPIAHSRSPLIHRHWLDPSGIAGSYEAIDVAPDALPACIERLRQGEFVGGNVTIPHKEQAARLCDDLDTGAATIGAVNTLSTTASGASVVLRGDNTDLYGFTANLDQEAPGWSNNPGPAVVIGAGGAARAVVVALAQRRFEPIHILNRTPARAAMLARELSERLSSTLLPEALSTLSGVAPTTRLFVNTSAMGMEGSQDSQLPLDTLPPDALVTDIVYAPLRTPLLLAAAARGLRTVDGLGMLLHQAVPGFERWFGVRPEVTDALRTKITATL